jgi:hypothetical protein
MKAKIVIYDITLTGKQPENPFQFTGHRTARVVWEGDLDISEEGQYITKLSIYAEGQPQPICDVPFSLGTGHYQGIPAEFGEDPGDEYQEDGIKS